MDISVCLLSYFFLLDESSFRSNGPIVREFNFFTRRRHDVSLFPDPQFIEEENLYTETNDILRRKTGSNHFLSTIISNSIVTLNGSDANPSDVRACLPISSPKTLTRKAEHASTMAVCPVKSG